MVLLWSIHLASERLWRYARALRLRIIPLPILAAVMAMAWSAPSLADWNSAAENIRNHPTWIYTPPPSRVMANGKHVLFIVLHGCDQTHTQLRKFGNLTGTADDNAMVVAVPGVGKGAFGPGCWNYDGARDEAGHIGELVGLANDLIARPALNIDPKQVYIVGLSSGAAMALDVACKAPDVFAGVGAIAGPSVGSDQNKAVVDSSKIPATNPGDAARKCKALAGTRASHLDKQIAIIAFGDMDRNGTNSQFLNETLFTDNAKRLHAGQIALASVKWGDDNAKALQQLYGTDDLGPAESVQSGLGTQRIAKKNGKPRISLLTLHNVGHAWPAGTGQPNPIPSSEPIKPSADLATATRGVWIAQSGINYLSHAASWLIGNNVGPVVPPGMPVISVTASAAGNKIDVLGTATDPDGSVTRIETVLLKETSACFSRLTDTAPLRSARMAIIRTASSTWQTVATRFKPPPRTMPITRRPPWRT